MADSKNVTGAMIVHRIPQSHKHATCIGRARPTLLEVQEVVLARGGSFHLISYAAINLCGGSDLFIPGAISLSPQWGKICAKILGMIDSPDSHLCGKHIFSPVKQSTDVRGGLEM